ncbi:uncharacterized protein LOC116141580 [Pistacia vera]|uniref:uncharacterized protein LOC116141580 n=1 Tax=Pistacia vera TaxID=55513 RepID=UPI001262D8F6|nr:uncharacterized protein LOC116141580 [Pistacia vera]
MQHLVDEFSKLWNGWEIRMLILLSLFLQYILIIFGSRRKYIARTWIQILVWLAYMSADWVATVALGILARNSGDFKNNYSKSNHLLQAFWAPFLLLHLGGPGTITAYSLADNNLWLRHFLGLLVQVGVAFYVIVRSWSNNAITFLAIPVFITGIIKYGERTWVLRSSSTKQFRDSLLSDPNPGPDYANYVEAFESTIVEPDSLDEARVPQPEINPGVDYLRLADNLFNRFQYLFADLILGTNERIDCNKIIPEKSPEDAFKPIAVELGFMYDVLYTKATISYSQKGIILRFISFFSAICVLVAFCLIIDKHALPLVDIIITYLLIIGALVLEVYGFILLIISDWTKLWLSKNKNPLANLIRAVTSPFEPLFTKRARWSGSMAQYNLISGCLKPAKCLAVQKLFGIQETLEKYHYRTWKTIDVRFQKSICEQLREKGNQIQCPQFDIKENFKPLMAQRGDYVLANKGILEDFKWCTTSVEFDHSLLLWHIATDLYYHDIADDFDRNKEFYQISKGLSDYMLYLLVFCPSMLPKGIGEIRYRDTCAEARRFFKQRMSTSQKIKEACKALLQVNTNVPMEKIKGDRSQSVLFYGCKLAKQLKSLERQDEVWEMISQVWVEMLTYAASRCQWKEHGQQLTKGGELLTHVCLLMAHIGLSDQFQIQKDYINRLDSSVLDQVFRNKCFLCFLGCTLCTKHLV